MRIPLNFVFSRNGDKKKIIWTLITSVVGFGIGAGLLFVGSLSFNIVENPDELFSLPKELVPNNTEVFTLLVNGESMINAGILDKDIVIVKRQKDANNGEIVVAMTDENEVTLKRFYKEKNHIRLQPENDSLDPIILNNVTILGKAIGLYRKI